MINYRLEAISQVNIPLETHQAFAEAVSSQKVIDLPVYRIAEQYKRRNGSIPVEKHSINRRQTDAKLKKHSAMAEIQELVLTFLERLSHNALPKNRKRETLDACITPT